MQAPVANASGCTTLAELSEGYALYAGDILRHCLFRKVPREDAEEIVQDTFERACRFLQQDKQIECLRGFLFRIANNLIVDWSRRRKSRQTKECSLEELCDKGFDPGADGTVQLKNRLEAQTLLRLGKQLDADDYQLLVLRYIDGLPPRDIAKRLGRSPNAISVRLHRALRQLTTLAPHSHSHS